MTLCRTLRLDFTGDSIDDDDEDDASWANEMDDVEEDNDVKEWDGAGAIGSKLASLVLMLLSEVLVVLLALVLPRRRTLDDAFRLLIVNGGITVSANKSGGCLYEINDKNEISNPSWEIIREGTER